MIAEAGLPRTAVVGVLGGGQLGKMLALEAVRRGGTVAAVPAWTVAVYAQHCLHQQPPSSACKLCSLSACLPAYFHAPAG